MARVLIVFGTTDGHTRTVAHRLAKMFALHAADVDILEAGTEEANPLYYDAVVVCASVHAGGYQRNVTTWVRVHAPALRNRRTAFVSVCLGILQHDPQVDRDLDRIAERFFAATGWRPTSVKRIAGALLYRQYGWLKRLIMKRIVSKAHGDTDTSRNYEYTDWSDLQRFVDDFMRLVAAVPRPFAAPV
jgi:menaquinone-dependent protoporphyrinogen oxidase